MGSGQLLRELSITPPLKATPVRTRPNGQRSDVHVTSKNMDIHHGLNGNRSVEAQRPTVRAW